MLGNLDRLAKYKARVKTRLLGDIDKSKDTVSFPRITRNFTPFKLRERTGNSSKRILSNLRDSTLLSERTTKFPSVKPKHGLLKFRQYDEIAGQMHKPFTKNVTTASPLTQVKIVR